MKTIAVVGLKQRDVVLAVRLLQNFCRALEPTELMVSTETTLTLGKELKVIGVSSINADEALCGQEHVIYI